jgi:hypothetical protein
VGRFFAIGARLRRSEKLAKAIDRAIEFEREEQNARFLGYQRNHSRVRARPGK